MSEPESNGTSIAIRLLAAGYDASQVASDLEVDLDVIQAVIEEYQQQIVDMATSINKTPTTEVVAPPALSHDQKIDAVESKLLEKLDAMVGTEVNTMKVAKLFQVINSAKRRSNGEGITSGPVTVDNRQVVMLNLPEHLTRVPEYQTNPQNEVVAVEGRPLAIASTRQVARLAGLEVEDSNEVDKQVLAGD